MLAWSVALAFAGLLARPSAPEPIVGGQQVGVCDFPASTFIGSWGGFHCTASLVHPRVVVTAAHCIGNIDMVGFGEDVWNPAYTVATASCAAHPDYDGWGIDLGVCTLAEDAPAVAMVPLLMGCEADELVPGALVTLAGFGQSDEASGTGGGYKRTTTNTIDRISLEYNEAYLLGNYNGSCYGDSGGPAYVQLADGSWRVFAAVSGPHPDAPPLGCGYGGTYELIYPELAWIESQTGYDVTPCFDADGTWSPDARCTEFPLQLDGGGSWDAMCGPAMVSGPGASCGAPPGGGGDPGGDEGGHGSDDGGDPGDGGGHGSSDGGDDGPPGGTSSGAEPGDDDTGAADDGPDPIDPVLPPGFGLGGESSGCALGAGAPRPGLLLALLVLGRRRRRSAIDRR